MTDSAWQRLSGLDAYRVTQIPRWPGDDQGLDPDARDTRRAQRGAVLTAAYHAAISGAGAAGPVAVGWVRTAPGSPVHVLIAGSALRGSANRAASHGTADKTARRHDRPATATDRPTIGQPHPAAPIGQPRPQAAPIDQPHPAARR